MGKAQQGNGQVVGDALLVRGTRHELVKNRQRVTHRPATGADDQWQYAIGDLNTLFGAELSQVVPQNLRGHQAEGVVVGTRTNSAEHLVRLGGRKNKLNVRRRLFHDLEQGVKALAGDHVSLVDNENLVAVAHRRKSSAFAQVTGVVHTAVASGVHLNHIEGTATVAGKLLTGLAHTTRGRGGALRTVEAARQNTRRSGLATPARPRE